MQNFKLCLLGLAGFGIAVTFSHELRADDCPNGTANGCVDYTKPKPLKKGPCARVEVINEGRCTLFVTSPKAECNKTSLRYLVLNNDYPYRRGKVHVRQGDSVNLRCFSKKKQIKNIQQHRTYECKNHVASTNFSCKKTKSKPLTTKPVKPVAEKPKSKFTWLKPRKSLGSESNFIRAAQLKIWSKSHGRPPAVCRAEVRRGVTHIGYYASKGCQVVDGKKVVSAKKFELLFAAEKSFTWYGMTAKRKIPGWAVKGGGDSKKKYTICFLLVEKGRLLPGGTYTGKLCAVAYKNKVVRGYNYKVMSPRK